MAVPQMFATLGVEQNATTGDITVPWPVGHTAGMIGLLFVETANQTVSLTTANGFVEVGSQATRSTGTAGSTGATRLAVYWCRATSGSMASPVVSSSGGNHIYGRIIGFTGCVRNGNPWDVTADNVKTTASTTTTISSLTTTVNDCLVVFAASRDNDSSGANWSSPVATGLTSLTERSDSGTTSGNGGGIGVWTGEKATAGSSGTFTATSAASVVEGEFAIALKPEWSPTVTLNSPADASSGSDTTPTLDFTGTDINGDSIEYNVQIDTVNTFDSAGGSSDVSYSESNQDSTAVNTQTYFRWGQSFTSVGGTLTSAKHYIRKQGSPTGNLTATLYALSGAIGGNDDVPTGAALATSDVVDVSTISGSLALVTFTFSGANQYALVNGTSYVIVFERPSADGITNYVIAGYDSTPSGDAGNICRYNGTWSAVSGKLCFYVTSSTAAPLLNKVSTTDAGFVNPDTGGDTHPFNSGENIQYTVQAGDTLAADIYYWRVRGIDPTGSNTYGNWSPTFSFEVAAAGVTLTMADASHSHSVDNTVLTQAHTLTVADATHSHSVDNAVLTQAHTLTVAEASQAHSADNVVLVQSTSLTVADATHSHTVDNAVLTQKHTLTVADSSQAHTVDNLDIIVMKFYNYESKATLPSDDMQVANPFTATDYTNASSDNGTYVASSGDEAYNIFMFQERHVNNTDAVTVDWNGKSSIAGSVKPIRFQVFNYDTATWETKVTNNTVAANTDFSMQLVIDTNISDYYGTNNSISVRVYQENI